MSVLSIIVLAICRLIFLTVDLIFLFYNENLLERIMFYDSNKIFD